MRDRHYDDEGRLVREKVEDSVAAFQGLTMFLFNPMPFNPATAVMGGGTRTMALEDEGVGALTWPQATPVFAPNANTLR